MKDFSHGVQILNPLQATPLPGPEFVSHPRGTKLGP